jgi:flagellar basal-body rod protein FlgB
MTAKMGYLDHRQKVLAQNIANADTPGYQAHDLTKVDFGVMLKNITGDHLAMNPVNTQAGHMSPGGNIDNAKDREQRMTYEVAPAGNAVSLEEQMINASRNTVDYNLMTTLYQKNVNMIRTALGRTQ